jgi:hypothetical protein
MRGFCATGGFREVNTSVSSLQSAIQGLQVSLPLTYTTRVDLQERLKLMEEQMVIRLAAVDKSNLDRDTATQKQLSEFQTTIRQLIFAIIGALISGGLALLIEVLKLLGGQKP